jgi:hypothetical protein
MAGYFAVVAFGLVTLLLVVNVALRIGPLTGYTPDRYGLSESRHSSPTQSLGTAPPPAPETTSEAILAARPKPQSAPEIPAKVEPEARAAPEIPARVEPAARAAPEVPAKVEPAARAARAQAPPMKKRIISREQLHRQNRHWSRDADSFIRYLFFGR